MLCCKRRHTWGFNTGNRNNNSSSSRITTADQRAAYDVVWMHDSPARQHVRQPVADRDATTAGSQLTAWQQQQDLQHVSTPADRPLTKQTQDGC
jgi:hypothetical protein